METVQHVKELQRKFKEVVGVKMKTQLPAEDDSVSLSPCENEKQDANDKRRVVKATVCCEDRPELNQDLIQLLRLVKGTVTRAEMMTVGGRTKLVMTLKLGLGEAEIGRVRRGLLAVAENRLSGHLMGRFVMPNQTDGGLLTGGGVCKL